MSTLAHIAAQTFFSALWQGAAVVFAVTLALRMLPRLTATIRFGVWLAAFFSAAVVPFIHLSSATTATTSTPVLRLGPGWVLGIAACWLALSTIRLTRLALSALHLRRIWNNATPLVASADLQAILDTAPRRPELCLSSDVDSPSVIGFLLPRLLVPASLYRTLTQPELRQIALHECEHLRRRDDWINLLQKLVLALLPLHPALLFADRRLGLERELACDAAVVHASAAPFDYARALTRFAEERILARPVALALSAWGRQSELARRVYTLLCPTSVASPRAMGLSVAVLSTALVAGAVELTHAPNLISFAGEAAPIAETSILSPLSTSPRMVPVVYHPPTAVRQTSHQPARRVIHHLTRLAVASSQPRIILTTARSTSQAPNPGRLARPAYILTTDFSPTYAAVPFANGWLIIQL